MMNEYESLIYSSRDFIQDEDTYPYFKNEEERDKLLLLVNEEEEWLDGDGATANYETIKNKHKSLEKKITPIRKRKTVRESLPEEISNSRKKLDENEKSFKKYIKKRDWLPDSEIEEYRKLLTEKREDLDKKSQELEDAPLNKKAPFSSDDVRKQSITVVEKLKYIKRIRKPKPEIKDVESHGELLETPKEDKIKKPKTSKTEEARVTDEDEIRDGTKFKLDDDMKEQVERLLEKDRLKKDIVDGKVKVEDLSAEDIQTIGL